MDRRIGRNGDFQTASTGSKRGAYYDSPPKWALGIGQKSCFFAKKTINVIDSELHCSYNSVMNTERKKIVIDGGRQQILQVRIDREVVKKAREKAILCGLSVSDVVRNQLTNYVNDPNGVLIFK